MTGPTPTATPTAPAAAPSARAAEALAWIVRPITAHASVIGGLFPGPDGAIAALHALRAARATNDVVGLAIPLDGDPTGPDAAVAAVNAGQGRRRGLKDILVTMIDPHRQVAQPTTFARGRTGLLAQAILGDLTRWLVGVLTFRVPA